MQKTKNEQENVDYMFIFSFIKMQRKTATTPQFKAAQIILFQGCCLLNANGTIAY